MGSYLRAQIGGLTNRNLLIEIQDCSPKPMSINARDGETAFCVIDINIWIPPMDLT